MDYSQRISALKAKKDAVMAKLAKAEGQQAREERRLSVRKKVLIGVAVLRACEHGRISQEAFHQLLEKNLTPKDLEVFKFLNP
jgi:hypothetical protein